MGCASILKTSHWHKTKIWDSRWKFEVLLRWMCLCVYVYEWDLLTLLIPSCGKTVWLFCSILSPPTRLRLLRVLARKAFIFSYDPISFSKYIMFQIYIILGKIWILALFHNPRCFEGRKPVVPISIIYVRQGQMLSFDCNCFSSTSQIQKLASHKKSHFYLCSHQISEFIITTMI